MVKSGRIIDCIYVRGKKCRLRGSYHRNIFSDKMYDKKDCNTYVLTGHCMTSEDVLHLKEKVS